MIIKSKIDILGQDINIKFRKNLVVEEKFDDNKITKEKCDGAYIPNTNTIYLEATLIDNNQKLCETLMHEILECILSSLEIKIQHRIITQIATTLYGILRRNKIIKPIDFKSIIIEEDNGPV